MFVHLLALAVTFASTDTFREHTRNGVEIKTDLQGGALDDAFEEVEITRAAVTEFFETNNVKRKSTQSLRIRLFAHAADYDDFRRRTFDQRNDVRSMSFYDDSDRLIGAAWEGGQPRARGELRGQVARQMLGNYSKNSPPWIEEAIFGYFEGIEADAFGDVIDVLNRQRHADMRRVLETGKYCPLFDLMDMREDQFYGLAGAPNNSLYPRETLYAESWSILYFLVVSPEPADRKLLAAVAERIDTGRWSQAGQAKALAEMEPRWKTFLTGDAAGHVGQLRRDAWEKFNRGDARAARDLAAEAVNLDKSNVSGHRALAHAALAAGDFTTAIASFAELRKLRPKDADAGIGHAKALLARGKEKSDKVDLDDAVTAATSAGATIAIKDRHTAYEIAAEACEAKSEPKAALKWVREARKQKGLTFEHDKMLAEWEDRLMKAAIGK
jgi:tetratricopeptide (TPR) repeat protein